MATIEFTAEDERELGAVLGRIFPNKTYPLLVKIIRDAILAAPKFAERVKMIAATEHPLSVEFKRLEATVASLEDKIGELLSATSTVEEKATEPTATGPEAAAEPEPETAVEPESQNDKDEEPTTAPPSPRRRTTTTKPATQAAEPKKDLASRVSAPPD